MNGTTSRKRLTALPDDVTTILFRMIVNRLRTDPVLGQVVKSWSAWEGLPTDKMPESPAQCPWVMVTPRPTGEAWFSPEKQAGWIYIQLKVATVGTCADDVLNLWGAIRNALSGGANNPRSQAWARQLQDANAPKGLIEMSQPTFDPSADAGQDEQFLSDGMVRVYYFAPAAS